jgi:hypothetical protein
LFTVFFLCGRRTQIKVWFVPRGPACSSPSASGPDFCCWLLVSALRSRFPVSCLLPADLVFFSLSLPFFEFAHPDLLHSAPRKIFVVACCFSYAQWARFWLQSFLAATIFSFTRFVLASATLVCVAESFSSRVRSKRRRLVFFLLSSRFYCRS